MSAVPDPSLGYRPLADFTLGDLEALRIVLRGGSVIDWHRVNFADRAALAEFLLTHDCDLARESDAARLEAIKDEAIAYLRRQFDFPVPRSVQTASALDVFELAAGRGHKQVCACVILKTMHIIHHLQGRELLVMLPLSDAEVFNLVEEKVYRVVGGMLAAGLPIAEFLGGRKNRDSLYTKLLSKRETIAAQIYDKLRFRIVTRTPHDLLPVLNYLSRRLFPFNYVIPGESTNTLLDVGAACRAVPAVARLLGEVQGGALDDGTNSELDNRFSARDFRTIHFVVDLPVRVPTRVLERAPASAEGLGQIVFVLVEFQIVDQQTEAQNELGEASHARYKERQRRAVMERLRMGFRQASRVSLPDVPDGAHEADDTDDASPRRPASG